MYTVELCEVALEDSSSLGGGVVIRDGNSSVAIGGEFGCS